MTRYILNSPYAHLIAWTVGIALVIQMYKRVARWLNVREHPTFERTLPLIPVAIGAVSGALLGEILGVAALVKGDSVPWTVGIWYGAGVGFVASGLFRAVIAYLGDDSTLAEVLRQYEGGG